MFRFKTGALVAAAGALAVAMPAAAHPGPPHPNGNGHSHGNSQAGGNGHSHGAHGCGAHNVAYIVYGTIDASQGTVTVTDGTASAGTLEVDVVRTNRWARGDRHKTQPVAYTLGPKTTVKLDGGTTTFSAGERVKLIGRASVITNKHCTNAGMLGTPTFRMVVVHPAAS